MKKVKYTIFLKYNDINEWYKDHQDCQIINIETHTYDNDFVIETNYKVWYIEEDK